MRLKLFRQAVGVVLLVVSLGLIIWATWPAAISERVVSFPSKDHQSGEPSADPQRESTVLRITWPARMQVGATGEIQVSLVEEDQANLNSESHKVGDETGKIIEARLDFPGVQFAPAGAIRQGLTNDRPVNFQWQVRPIARGKQRGSVWLHQAVAYENNSASSKTNLIAIQTIDIQARGLSGLTAYSAQLFAVAGFIVGLILSWDLLYNWYTKTSKNWSKKP